MLIWNQVVRLDLTQLITSPTITDEKDQVIFCIEIYVIYITCYEYNYEREREREGESMDSAALKITKSTKNP